MNASDHKIMVIGGDDNSVETMSSYLRARGFRVKCAKTSLAVVNKVQSEAPSLVIIDLMSPRREGLRICQDLGHNWATQHIPIITVTAECDESDKIVALELGVDDHLKKPFNPHELTLRIERSLARADARTNVGAEKRLNQHAL